MKLVRIVLHGFLGKKFGRKHRYYIETPAEGYRALCATLPGFEQAFIKFPHCYAFVADGVPLEDTKEGALPVDREMHIVPVVKGSGKFGKIIIGAAIAIVGLIVPGGQWAVQFGLALALSGVADLLTKKPKMAMATNTQDPERVESYFFRGPLNTTQQGLPVPVCYGDVFVGSVVVSAGIRTYDLNAQQQAVAPPDTASAAVDTSSTQPIDPAGQQSGYWQAFLASGGLISYGWEPN